MAFLKSLEGIQIRNKNRIDFQLHRVIDEFLGLPSHRSHREIIVAQKKLL